MTTDPKPVELTEAEMVARAVAHQWSETTPARLVARTIQSAGDCWPWQGTLTDGYGYIFTGPGSGQRQRVHRVAYQLLVGPIPEGLVLDHLCRVRNCLNPAHLEPVTPAENTRRGELAVAIRNGETCRKGEHPWPQSAVPRSDGGLRCGECEHQKWARNQEKRASCDVCGLQVLAKNLPSHRRKQHDEIGAVA